MAIAAMGTLTYRHQRQVDVLRERSAKHQAKCTATAGNTAVNREGLRPFLGLRKEHTEQRQCSWRQNGSEGSL